MKTLFLLFFLLPFGCRSFHPAETDLNTLQEIWNSKDPSFAMKKVPGLHVVKETSAYTILGTDNKIYVFSLLIRVSKKTKKIISIEAPVNHGDEVTSTNVKRRLPAKTWKIYEHSQIGKDKLRVDITEYCKDLGAGFAYSKFDKKKNTRMIYWGRSPLNIQIIL